MECGVRDVAVQATRFNARSLLFACECLDDIDYGGSVAVSDGMMAVAA